MILSEKTRDAVLMSAWVAYASVYKSIDAMASIGLDLDGGKAPAKTGCQHLYAAMTGSANIIMACCGIPRKTVQAEQLDMFLSQTAGGVDPSDPESVKSAFSKIMSAAMDMKDTYEKNRMRVPWDGTPGMYEVTVSMSGGITVPASSEKDAMAFVNGMTSEDIVEGGAWDSPAATDAYRS